MFGDLVVIQDIGNLVDQFYDLFGVEVTWGSFTCEHDGSGYYIIPLFGGHCFDL